MQQKMLSFVKTQKKFNIKEQQYSIWLSKISDSLFVFL